MLFTASINLCVQYTVHKHSNKDPLAADDQRLLTSILGQLSTCLESVKNMMDSSILKLNPDNIEFLLFGTSKQRSKITIMFPTSLLVQPNT